MTSGKNDWLAEQFEKHRTHLRAVAYRMLGSQGEADDAVQEAWLRLSRTGGEGIENLGGWLTTVVARVALDALRSRKTRREEALDDEPAPALPAPGQTASLDPEQEAILADSVSLALLVVLDRLDPPERVAFVMHDMFSTPFEEIAPILGRTPVAVRKLASRARERVRGGPALPAHDLSEQRKTVEAFLAAMRAGDFNGIVAALDPNVVVRIDEAAARPGAPREVHGAEAWARGAIAFSQYARFTQPALIDGSVGLIFAPGGRLIRVLKFTHANGRIANVKIIADPAHLRQLDLAVLGNAGAVDSAR